MRHLFYIEEFVNLYARVCCGKNYYKLYPIFYNNFVNEILLSRKKDIRNSRIIYKTFEFLEQDHYKLEELYFLFKVSFSKMIILIIFLSFY